MEKFQCELCSFKNPKATATAIIIKDNKILLLKRSQEPFFGKWDLPGGYLNENESPKQAVRREITEELGVSVVSLTFIKALPGQAQWKEQVFPILSHFFLVEVTGDIKLNQENNEYRFADIRNINPNEISFDSNQAVIKWIKESFAFDLDRVTELTRQLDDSAIVNEQSLYKAILNGFVSKIYDKQKLIGLGWIFPRQTMLRKQAVIEDMIVDQAYRGKGCGQKMLLELIDWAKKEGVDTIELTSNPKRIAANELYKKVGFQLHPTNHYLYKIQ